MPHDDLVSDADQLLLPERGEQGDHGAGDESGDAGVVLGGGFNDRREDMLLSD